MTKNSSFSFAIGRVIAGIILGAVLFSAFKMYLRNTYNTSIEAGFDDIFGKYKNMVTRYDAGELDVTFIDIISNLYSSDYMRLAKINEDGSFDIFFETDYDVVPVERSIHDWVYLTDNEDLLAIGQRTDTINNSDWTICYKTSEEIHMIDSKNYCQGKYFDNSWNVASIYAYKYNNSQFLFKECVDASGALLSRLPFIESYYEDGNSFHIGKMGMYDAYMNNVSYGQNLDFTDPSKSNLYNTLDEKESLDFQNSVYFRTARPDAFLQQNGDIFLAENISVLEKFYNDRDIRVQKQVGEDISFCTSMSDKGHNTIGRLAVIEINGQKYLVESVYTTLNYRDYFKPVFLIAGIVLLIFSVGIPCLTAIRPYSQYKKAYENNRFKNNLIDSLAHNLKTPLQILGGYAENLKDVSDAAEKDHYADQILAKTQEMNADIESILKAADKTSIILTRTSARKIFEEAAKKAGTDIDIKGDREIKADRDYFLSAAFNLIDNAAKYKTGDSGIEVSILPKDITVRNRTDKDKFTPGTGLAIAGRIIEQHGLRLMTDLKDGVFEARITKK